MFLTSSATCPRLLPLHLLPLPPSAAWAEVASVDVAARTDAVAPDSKQLLGAAVIVVGVAEPVAAVVAAVASIHCSAADSEH